MSKLMTKREVADFLWGFPSGTLDRLRQLNVTIDAIKIREASSGSARRLLMRPS